MTSPNPFPPSLAGGNHASSLTVDALTVPAVSSLTSLSLGGSSVCISGNVGICGPAGAHSLDVSGDVACSGKFLGDGSLLTNLPSSGGGGGGGTSMFKNAVINGAMQINQRGFIQTFSTAGSTGSTELLTSYVVDRFSVYRGSYVSGINFCQLTYASGTVGTNLPYTDAGIMTYARVGRGPGDTSTNTINMRYAFEPIDSNRLYGKTITLSFYYYTGATFSGTNLAFAFLTAGSTIGASLQRGQTPYTTQGSTVAPSTSWVRATYTFTLASLSTANMFAGLSFSYTPSGTAGSTDQFFITGVQVEVGSSATTFELRPYSLEMLLCRRYCVALSTSSTFDSYLGMNFAGANAQINVSLSTPLRTFPGNVVYSYLTKQPNVGDVQIQAPSSSAYYNDGAVELMNNANLLYTLQLIVPCAALSAETPSVVSVQFGGMLCISAEM